MPKVAGLPLRWNFGLGSDAGGRSSEPTALAVCCWLQSSLCFCVVIGNGVFSHSFKGNFPNFWSSSTVVANKMAGLSLDNALRK